MIAKLFDVVIGLGVSFELILVEGPVEEFFDGPFVVWLFYFGRG